MDFKEIFGFQPKGENRHGIEMAIVHGKINTLAGVLFAIREEENKLLAKYPESKPAGDLKQALEDLSNIDAIIEERTIAFRSWHEAVKVANTSGYKFSDNIDTYATPTV